MSAELHARLAATATRLITKHGRPITFVAENRTPADVSKPWGPPALAGDPPAVVETTLSAVGVFVPPNTVRQFGVTALGRGTEFMDLMAMSEQIVIVNSANLRPYRILRDSKDNTDWGIIGIQELEPGTVEIISFVAVRR